MKRSIVAVVILLVAVLLAAGGHYGWRQYNLLYKNSSEWEPTGRTASSKSIRVEYAYAFATPSGAKNGAVFLTLRNLTGDQDFLTGVKTDIAEHAELHETFMDENNVMMMRKVDRVELPQGYDEMLMPNGKHIMLIGLRRELKAGELFDVRLDFEKSGDIVMSILVVPPGEPLDAMNDEYPEGFEGTHEHGLGVDIDRETGEIIEPKPPQDPPSIKAAE